MTFGKRLLLLMVIDSGIVSFSIFMSHFFLNPYTHVFDTKMIMASITLLITHHIFSSFFGLYRRVWRYASVPELIGIGGVVTLSILSTAGMQLLLYQDTYERALVVTWMLHIILIGGVRFAWKYYKTYGFHFSLTKLKESKEAAIPFVEGQTRTLIIGAGSAGRMLARQMKESEAANVKLIGFVDDDFTMRHLNVTGLPVYGAIKDLSSVVEKQGVNHIVIAMPSVEKARIKEIVSLAQSAVKNVQILPMIEDLVMGNISVNQIRDVSIEDLLGREPVELDMGSVSETLTNRTILVTGAGGSIGSEICRQICKFEPKRIVLLGHGENSIYTIEMELRNVYKDRFEIITEIADVQHREKMMAVMAKHKPDVVYHAAAHKHVPLMERNPEEAVKNNVIGTKNVAEASDANGIGTFVMVSTDKAVNPTSVMGASKRMAEMIVQDMDARSETRFVAVRFGNVLGSRGSVIPLFKKQIAQGGPVTVTHPDMIRYFMTIPEASRLVIQAGSLAKGGEIFVLDMGEPVKITHLAKNLIQLSGFEVDDIGIEFTGMRPGEKLYEELLGKDEVHDERVWEKIYVGKALNLNLDHVMDTIETYDSVSQDVLRERVVGIANGRVVEGKALLAVK
ncbi:MULTISPECIES: polysaccharide biosynthesis protein [Pontibacillus]|uniref:Nucleoside-diphosphate sugar epimerase/dehydratase n=1 Tax=Pontibacillus chungwhensis TaxID=265426 RepID=A0ABY8UX01_9BACI|nr:MULTISPECIES: nucleoside-diphosphate sugar epimerase/dehydratase [Pontibacillus]MCD5324120.1 polysaccharide biosynthesis protein [Pontibacillus sp. HN14]WIF97823.1 nucleoside-diphosphate sugar epimerase/dehydratase [Pontibacillus chungwhensis]